MIHDKLFLATISIHKFGSMFVKLLSLELRIYVRFICQSLGAAWMMNYYFSCNAIFKFPLLSVISC